MSVAIATLVREPHLHWLMVTSREKACCILLREGAIKFTSKLPILLGGRAKAGKFAPISALKNASARHTVKGTI